ncbi:Uncharacterized protein QTN25_009342 [Entamoeba marina]
MQSINNETYVLSELVTALKMVIVSLPNLERVIQGSYNKIFGSKTLAELFVYFVPLAWGYVRNKAVPIDEKIQFFRLFFPNNDCDEIIDKVHTINMFELDLKQINTFISNVHEKKMKILSSPPSPEEKFFFSLVLQSTELMDKQQIAPIEKLVDPTYFSPMSNQKPNETIQRMDVSSQVTKLFEHASSEQLEKYVEFLQSEENWNGWDLKVDLSSISIVTLNHFLKQFSK